MWNRQEIFAYFDGEDDVWGDPLEIHHALTAALDGDVNKVLREAHSTDAVLCNEAMKKLIPAIRSSFRLKEFDGKTGQGANWKRCVEALNAFVAWEETQKKSGGPDPMSSSAVAAPTS